MDIEGMPGLELWLLYSLGTNRGEGDTQDTSSREIGKRWVWRDVIQRKTVGFICKTVHSLSQERQNYLHVMCDWYQGCIFTIRLKYTQVVRSKMLSKLIFASCVWYSDRAYYGLCVLLKGTGRRLPLEQQCSYQGQRGDVRQSVHAN